MEYDKRGTLSTSFFIINCKESIEIQDYTFFTKHVYIGMEIIEVTSNWYNNEIISRTFLFEDDKSIDIDYNDNTVVDMDGFMVAPKSRLRKIEEKMGITIKE